ncbi:MAG: hypothetical protein KF693_10865 [Nitrospira sp.]|nr:hypothetical protein [Nitrospira sp.]
MTISNSKLPINLDDLLRQRTVDRDRIEYKAGWNPDAIIRTLCAFARLRESGWLRGDRAGLRCQRQAHVSTGRPARHASQQQATLPPDSHWATVVGGVFRRRFDLKPRA